MLSNKVEPRDYQLRTVRKVIKAITEEGHKRILVIAPTGAGKTIMAYMILEELLKHYPNYTYGWTVMRSVLLEQAKRENLDKFGLTHGTYFSSFASELPKVDILIEDEGQHSAADTAVRLNSLINPKIHISFTATPFRTDRKKLCFSKIIYDAGIRQLVDLKYLSSFNQYVTNSKWSPEMVSELYLREKDKWGKSVMFFPTLDQCAVATKILLDKDVKAAVVRGGESDKTEETLAQFKEDKLEVLLNVFVLTEGFDEPSLRTAFIRPSERGPVVQMAGRALRKHPQGLSANIVQNTDTRYMFSEEASAEDKLIWNGDVWESRKGDIQKLNEVQMNTALCMMNAPEHKMPAFIAKHKQREHRRLFPERERGFNTEIPTEAPVEITSEPLATEAIAEPDSSEN